MAGFSLSDISGPSPRGSRRRCHADDVPEPNLSVVSRARTPGVRARTGRGPAASVQDGCARGPFAGQTASRTPIVRSRGTNSGGFMLSTRRLVMGTVIVGAVGVGTAVTAAFAGTGTTAGNLLTYAAASAEVNAITISLVGGHVAIADPGHLTPTSDCPAGSGALAGMLDCGLPGGLINGIAIRAGDGADSVTIDASLSGTGIPRAVVDGGDGNDSLTNASSIPTTFVGGGGNDTMNGNGIADTVDYSASATAVSLDVSLGWAVGEGSDTLNSLTNVTGSRFGDDIAGNAADNVLSGGGGDDTIDGRTGDDTITGGTGSDTASFAFGPS